MDFSTRLAKAQLGTFILTAISGLFSFIATLTPAWQVAEDTDVGRSVDSGLWLYCPGGAAQCWYIFSDDLINYYERVDVCRFLLIGDCRKKLLRTPYFFGWHYAVLILMLIALTLIGVALVSIAVAYFRPKLTRIATIVTDVALCFAFLLVCIGLAVFIINAEMLESKYLIGVKNVFPKYYGYSFYLACVGLTVMLFAVLAAILLSTTVFFLGADPALGPGYEQTSDFVMNQQQYRMMQEVPQPVAAASIGSYGQYNYSPSESSIPTRTFLSY
ncbi:Protein CLC-5 [Aphelenchoides avenae]|nr:Protein CLC-5 [Aphelenchus avenae]